jgi:iron complex outermembrane receptor protein
MNRHLRILLKTGFVGLFVFMGVFSLYAQQKIITGVVKDSETGETLIGVNVTAATNKSLGTVTDLDGKYSLSVPDTVKALSFSFVGYTTQIVNIMGNVIDVKLSAGKQLSEVVVVGYGTQKVKEVTGAVTSVKEEDFNSGNVSNPIQLIQGKVAGLSIVKAGGDPNQDFTIRLRGLSTFGSNTQPLIIIDGVQGASLNSVDPQDIASMDILKDASAAAIYGTKAAQGVILITTKKGQLSQGEKIGNVEFSTAFTMEKIARKIQVLSAQDYLKFPKSVNLGLTVNENGDTIQGSTDWVDAITQTAYTQVYNLAISGGTEKSNYRVAFNYRQGTGVVLKTGYDQLNGRLNFQQKTLNNMLTLNLNLSGTLRNETYAQSDALRYAARYNPTAPIKGEPTDTLSQEWGGYFTRNDFDFVNPVSIIEQNTLDGQKNEIVGNLKADFEPITGLIFSAAYSEDWRNELYGQYWSKNSYWTPYATSSHLGYARKESDDHFHHLFEATGSYERNIDKFNFKILAGYSWQDNIDQSFFAYGKGFLTDAFSYNNLGSASGETTNKESMGSYKSGSTLIGYFGRLNGNWNDAVFATLNFRRDGSTMFGVNNKWGNFPGVSAGIDIRKFVEIPFINRLKLRGSYGQTGNLPPYPYISQLLFNVTDASFFYNGQYIQAYAPIRNENPDLKWEVKKEWDVGVDFNMWTYRLSGSIDYYNALSTDLILNAPVPVPPYPSGNMWLNVGELRNSGVELALSLLAVQQSHFKWTTDFNFSKYFPTKLVKITNDISNAQNALEFGYLGAPYLTGIRTIIICQGDTLPGYYNVKTQEYYVNHPNYVGQIVAPIYTGIDSTGKITVEDVNGDGIINYQKDVRVVGNGLPKFTIGWGNTFNYKGFYLNFFLRGAFGHSLVNVNNARYGNPGSIGVQNGMQQALDYMDASAPVYTNIHVEKADYVKLDNFSFGYNFNFEKSKYVSVLTLYISGQNLFTITNYSGVDPEIRYGDSYDNNNPLAPGIDRENTYFRTRSLTVGVNISL